MIVDMFDGEIIWDDDERRDFERLAEAIDLGQRLEALEMLSAMFPFENLVPATVIRLADDRARLTRLA